MEQLQVGYLLAVATASGCNLANWSVDDGIDALIKHRSSVHRNMEAVLEVQLKSTHQVAPNPKSGRVSVQFNNSRFHLVAESNPTIKKIVVIMIVPPSVEDWVLASHDFLELRHCAYWASVRGQPTSGEKYTSVSASTNDIFDDHALCGIMGRIGQGGYP
ncbi:MAG: DUF4365 domain-containing protein [Pseudonocardia sp.]|nr:DUF4365 domain-containing protein [Pseudonocardia sp.]